MVVGFFTRYMSGVSLLMIISFLVANGTAVYKSESLLSPCGCFEDLLVVKTGDALVVDVMMMAMSLLLLLHRREFLSVDRLLRAKQRSGPKGLK